jgi:hypothetical protein
MRFEAEIRAKLLDFKAASLREAARAARAGSGAFQPGRFEWTTVHMHKRARVFYGKVRKYARQEEVFLVAFDSGNV